jgi:hypothetical protein
MGARITGTRYFFHRERYIQTGDLKAFDLMMKHYTAGGFVDFADQPGRRRSLTPESCIHPLAPAVGIVAEFPEVADAWRWEGCSGACEVHLCDICMCFFVRHTVIQACVFARFLGRTTSHPLV